MLLFLWYLLIINHINKIRAVFLVTLETTFVSMATFNQVGAVLLKKTQFLLLPFVDAAWPFPPSEYFISGSEAKRRNFGFSGNPLKDSESLPPKALD